MHYFIGLSMQHFTDMHFQVLKTKNRSLIPASGIFWLGVGKLNVAWGLIKFKTQTIPYINHI